MRRINEINGQDYQGRDVALPSVVEFKYLTFELNNMENMRVVSKVNPVTDKT